MTDSAGAMPPFPGFPGFPPAEMLDRMWGMMRLTPFGSAFPGSEPGAAQGIGPSLSMMSDMMSPLTNIEELDKRITDLRAVEQWLKLNLNMLQSAIQALEVQRATLSTLRAFGAFAQSQMSPPPAHEAPPRGAATSAFSASPASSASAGESAQTGEGDEAGAQAGFDASGWWNLLQSQFNQLAQFAMAQPAAAAQAAQAAAQAAAEASAATTGAATGAAGGEPAAARAKPAAKRSSSASGASASKTTARSTKKAPARPE
jgi:hypothetical protein